VHVVEGGDSGWRYPYQWITEPVARGPWNDEQLWHPAHPGQAAYIVPPVANLADGPAGLTHYPGTGLSSAYAGHFFLCDFRGDASSSGIHAFTVEPRGASFALGPVERFVWGTLATDCDFGPDGALWFSDWVYGWEQTGKGRLYRAFDPEMQRSELVQATRRLLAEGMGQRDGEELLGLLRHPDRRVRQAAHFALADRDETGGAAAVAMRATEPLLARLHALWALGIRARGGSRSAIPPLLALAQQSDPPELRAQALRALGDLPPGLCDPNLVRKRVVAGLGASEPRVRFHAALVAHGFHAAVQPLRRLLVDAGTRDPDLRHAAVFGLSGCATPRDLERLSRDPERDVRMGALLAARRRVAAPGREAFAGAAHDGPDGPDAKRSIERTLASFLADSDPLIVL
jgi:quinoprotein glucose dehydrogenase